MVRELVVFLWFLVGLFIGLGVLGWYHAQINSKLKRLVRLLNPEAVNWSFSSTSMLVRAIAAHGADHQILLDELETWKHICQVAPIGFLQVDQDNQLIRCNAQACKMLSIQRQDLPQPRLLLEIVRSYELDQLIEQTRAGGQLYQKEWIYHPVFADASVLFQQASCPLRGYGIPLAEGNVAVFLENRQEAVSVAQQRDRWISDVAHELKTPLTSIRLVAETLQLRVEAPQRAWIDRLLKETIRLSNLVHDLLEMNRLDAHPSVSKLDLKPIDLPKLVQSAWVSLEPLARQKQIQLEYIGPEHLTIHADESRLHRVLLNLLDNSVRYSSEQTSIKVQVRLLASDSDSGQVCLEVIDSGPGFPEKTIPFLFERFYRADSSRTRSHSAQEHTANWATSANRTPGNGISALSSSGEPPLERSSSGSGLGLAIVRQIVEAHGGSVKASNHPETHGAWLQIFLPQYS